MRLAKLTVSPIRRHSMIFSITDRAHDDISVVNADANPQLLLVERL